LAETDIKSLMAEVVVAMIDARDVAKKAKKDDKV